MAQKSNLVLAGAAAGVSRDGKNQKSAGRNGPKGANRFVCRRFLRSKERERERDVHNFADSPQFHLSGGLALLNAASDAFVAAPAVPASSNLRGAVVHQAELVGGEWSHAIMFM